MSNKIDIAPFQNVATGRYHTVYKTYRTWLEIQIETSGLECFVSFGQNKQTVCFFISLDKAYFAFQFIKSYCLHWVHYDLIGQSAPNFTIGSICHFAFKLIVRFKPDSSSSNNLLYGRNINDLGEAQTKSDRIITHPWLWLPAQDMWKTHQLVRQEKNDPEFSAQGRHHQIING